MKGIRGGIMPVYETSRVIVIDPASDRFGETGEVLACYIPKGKVSIGFEDKNTANFRDWSPTTDSEVPQVRSLQGIDTTETGGIQAALFSDRPRLGILAKVARDGNALLDHRLRAKNTFRAIIDAYFG